MEIKTIKMSEKGQISIPQEVRESMKLKKGDKLILIAKGEKITIQKADKLLDRIFDNENFSTMLASEKTLKKDWDNKEDERWNKY